MQERALADADTERATKARRGAAGDEHEVTLHEHGAAVHEQAADTHERAATVHDEAADVADEHEAHLAARRDAQAAEDP